VLEKGATGWLLRRPGYNNLGSVQKKRRRRNIEIKQRKRREEKKNLTRAKQIHLLHLAPGALNQPIRQLPHRRRLEVRVRRVRARPHLLGHRLDDVPAAVAQASHAGAAAGVEDARLLGRAVEPGLEFGGGVPILGIPVVALGFSDEGDHHVFVVVVMEDMSDLGLDVWSLLVLLVREAGGDGGG